MDFQLINCLYYFVGSCGNFAKVTNIETCNRCGQINSCSLCMKILSNSALDLTVGCLDKGFEIGNLVEWEVNGEIIEKDSNTNNESCLTLNWSQGNLLKCIDNKIIKRCGISRLNPLFKYRISLNNVRGH